MTYHVARNNQQLGTFSKDEILSRYSSGAILPTDLVWTDGMATWEPASKIFGAPVAPAGGGVDAPSTPPPFAAPPITGVATPIPPEAGGNVTAASPLPVEQRPANNMVLAIVGTVLNVLSCNFFGMICSIIAIVMSSQVNQKFDRGDVLGARSSAKTGKILGWVGIGLFVLGIIVTILAVRMMETMKHTLY